MAALMGTVVAIRPNPYVTNKSDTKLEKNIFTCLENTSVLLTKLIVYFILKKFETSSCLKAASLQSVIIATIRESNESTILVVLDTVA